MKKQDFIRLIPAQSLVIRLLNPIYKYKYSSIKEITKVNENSFEFVTEEGEVIIELIDNEIIKTILYCKYSQIPRNYLKNNFSSSTDNFLYRIVDKDEYLKTYLEQELGCTIPESNEYWSKLEEHIYM